jgi:MFS family permease
MQLAEPPAQPPISPQARHCLAALAIIPILATVYQTMVLTDVTNDVIRNGIQAEHYDMIWPQVCWGVAMAYGVFIAIWTMPRYGGRITIFVGLGWFLVGNFLCGDAVSVLTLAIARFIEGIGKGMVIMTCRSLLYRQFDKMMIVAVGIYGVFAYATRPTTPLLTAWINATYSWRWIYWVNVPLALLAFPLVVKFVRPDRPAKPIPLQIDWIAVTMFVGWAVCIMFTFTWYRKWGGWNSGAFKTMALLSFLLIPTMAIWLGHGFSFDEHIRRMFRVRVWVLAMATRALLLFQLLAVLFLLSTYCLYVRNYPRVVAGVILAPATLTMTASTILSTYFHDRRVRHFWLLLGVLGCAASLWRLSSIDSFTGKEHISLQFACWGFFVGLIPPCFLQDEVDSILPGDFLYGGAFAATTLAASLLIVPAVMNTTVSAWTDRALDTLRSNVSENRPEVQIATSRIADYYRQHGVEGGEVAEMSSMALGGFVQSEATAYGVQNGFQLLSLIVGGFGMAIVTLFGVSYFLQKSPVVQSYVAA